MFFHIGPEAKLINPVNNLSQIITALNTVFQLTENLPDLVLDSSRALSRTLESFQIGKQLSIYKLFKIISRQRIIVVNLAVGSFWSCP